MSDPPREETRKRVFPEEGEAVQEIREIEQTSNDENQPSVSDERSDNSQSSRKQMRFAEFEIPEQDDGETSSSVILPFPAEFLFPSEEIDGGASSSVILSSPIEFPSSEESGGGASSTVTLSVEFTSPEEIDSGASSSVTLTSPIEFPFPEERDGGASSLVIEPAPINVHELEKMEQLRLKDTEEEPLIEVEKIPNEWFYILEPSRKRDINNSKLIYYHADYSFSYGPRNTNKKLFYSSVFVPCVKVLPLHSSFDSPMAFFDPGHRPSYVTVAFLRKYISRMRELKDEYAPHLNDGKPGIVLNYRYPKNQETYEHPFILKVTFIKSNHQMTGILEAKVLVLKQIDRFSEVIFFGADQCEEMRISIMELGEKLQGEVNGMVFDTPITLWCSMILRILYQPEETNSALNVSDQMKSMLFRTVESAVLGENYVNHIESGVTDKMLGSWEWRIYFGDYIHEYQRFINLALPFGKSPLLPYFFGTSPSHHRMLINLDSE